MKKILLAIFACSLIFVFARDMYTDQKSTAASATNPTNPVTPTPVAAATPADKVGVVLQKSIPGVGISGVNIGMQVEDVIGLARKEFVNPVNEVTPHWREVRNELNKTFGVTLPEVIEEISVHKQDDFNYNFGEIIIGSLSGKVIAVTRNWKFGQGERPTVENSLKTLTDRYGPPMYAPADKNTAIWVFKKDGAVVTEASEIERANVSFACKHLWDEDAAIRAQARTYCSTIVRAEWMVTDPGAPDENMVNWLTVWVQSFDSVIPAVEQVRAENVAERTKRDASIEEEKKRAFKPNI